MSEKEPQIIISACLAGIECNYKGQAKPNPEVIRLIKEGKAIPVCPEQLGGLTTPRTPAERKGERVITKNGDDVTALFEKGADEVCKLCDLAGCKKAILKARSPSCGKGKIYDGTFTGTLVDRDGVLAEKLGEIGVEVYTEEEI